MVSERKAKSTHLKVILTVFKLKYSKDAFLCLVAPLKAAASRQNSVERIFLKAKKAA